MARDSRPTIKQSLILLYVSAMAMLLTVAASAALVQEDPLEREMLAIANELRCTVCQNQPISESDADLARDMRQIIREQLAAGKSRQEIMDFFVARYGDYVLMKPPVRGPGILVWFTPVAVLLIMAVSAFIYLRHRRQATLPQPPTLSPDDAERVRRARQQAPE